MLATLTNCQVCLRAFNDELGRGMCAACYGQRIFGRTGGEKAIAQPREAKEATPAGLGHADHVLRCEVYAQKGRAHNPSERRGAFRFW